MLSAFSGKATLTRAEFPKSALDVNCSEVGISRGLKPVPQTGSPERISIFNIIYRIITLKA
jgi:hypothetical protein